MKVEKRSIRMEDAVRYTVNRQRTGVQDEENHLRINFKETTHFFFFKWVKTVTGHITDEATQRVKRHG